MGSILSAIMDDYDLYLHLCKLKSIKPLSSRDEKSFYDHAKEIIKGFTPEEEKEHSRKYWYNCLK